MADARTVHWGRVVGRRTPVAVMGALLAGSGMLMLVGAAVDAGRAVADTAPFELFCPGTPIGDLALNDVAITGSLSPAAPTAGQQFTLQGFQAQVTIPAAIVKAAAVVGNTSLTGTATSTISVTGAAPSTMPTGALAYDVPIPNPVPASGLQFTVPTTPASFGPFTATSSNVAVSLGAAVQLTFSDVALSGLPPFSCSAYPNDVESSGIVAQPPPGLPITPVIAYAGTPPPPPGTATVTGPYELYCPGTPVGDLDFNGVTTSATISPSTLAAGDQFHLTGYQVAIPVPPGPVSSAVGLANNSFQGLATSYVDAYGASPAQMPTGSLGFDVPIPDPVPAAGVTVDLPQTPTTLGPFTADGGPLTVAQDQSILVVAKLSGKAFRMSCSAYANDSLATSGSTVVPPPGTPIRPIIAVADASGSAATTTTTGPKGPPGSPTPGGPYELYCPQTPVGDIAVNDVVTTGSITPATLKEGDAFQLTGLQTQFTIPQAVAQQLENLGMTTLSGDMSLFFEVTGTQYGYYYPGGISYGPTGSTGVASSSSGVILYPPYPVPGQDDFTFSVTLPSPVPAGGVQFTAAPAPGSGAQNFVAAGGPINVYVGGANLFVSAFGDQFGLFCDTLANNSVPTGLSLREPYDNFTQPLVTTGTAAIVPPPPGPPGAYELYCPGTPVGNVVLNDVETTASIPAALHSGQSFSVTNYQTTVNIPAGIASAAAALGNASIDGSATVTIAAIGASPSSLTAGPLNFSVPIPSPVPVAGLTLTVPATADTVGPFTATAGTVIVEEAGIIDLTLVISGNNLDLRCTAYPDNSVRSGITYLGPTTSPISPVIASSGPALIVNPSVGLTKGTQVSVLGSGFAASSSGTVLECNTAAGQPTVALGPPVSASLPVGCTPPTTGATLPTSANGSLSSTFSIATGTVGPPCGSAADTIPTCPPTDSGGNDPATDAAAYPCPPTPAQQAAGASCVLQFTDQAGASASEALTFGTAMPPPSPGGSGPYELFCPGTPVGNIALDGVTSTGTLSPADPAPGSQFQLTGYQTSVVIPAAIVGAAAALGNSSISGTATATVEASGATPASVSNTYTFDVPIPAPIPQTGLVVAIPTAAATIGPFTASGGTITMSEADQATLALSVSGNTLSLTCTAYPDGTIAPGGITSGTPTGSPVTPTITTSSSETPTTTGPTTTTTSPPTSTTTTSTSTTTTTASCGATTCAPNASSTTTTADPSGSTTTSTAAGTPTTIGSGRTTVPPASAGGNGTVTASSGQLAFTGSGGGSRLTATIGMALLLVGLLALAAADVPRQLRRRLARLGAPVHDAPGRAGRAMAGTASSRARWLTGRR